MDPLQWFYVLTGKDERGPEHPSLVLLLCKLLTRYHLAFDFNWLFYFYFCRYYCSHSFVPYYGKRVGSSKFFSFPFLLFTTRFTICCEFLIHNLVSMYLAQDLLNKLCIALLVFLRASVFTIYISQNFISKLIYTQNFSTSV